MFSARLTAAPRSGQGDRQSARGRDRRRRRGLLDPLLARRAWAGATSCSLERAQLTSGSTFHSAGLVGQLRSSLSLTQMMMNSVELYRAPQRRGRARDGLARGRLAPTRLVPERMEELERQAAWAETFGLPLHLVSAEEAQKLFPPMSIEGVHGAALLAHRRLLDPSQLTLALAKGARQRGATILTETRVTGHRGRRGAFEPSRPTRAASSARSSSTPVASTPMRSGVWPECTCPLVPMAHQYAITKPTGLPRDMPTVRDPSLLVYFRGESGGPRRRRLRAQPCCVGPQRHRR